MENLALIFQLISVCRKWWKWPVCAGRSVHTSKVEVIIQKAACRCGEESQQQKTTCPREHFHNANSEKQTFKVMSGIHALFIIWRIFIETIWWVIHNNNNKTPLNPGVFRSLQTDNRVEFQQCLPGFEVSMKQWPPCIKSLSGSEWNTAATAHRRLYRSVLQCSLRPH